ncbi:MAG TPA: Ig-like domain-containing protein [Gaiellaceae bacterium]|nr:Ig-like domain-containing protein [Gaiellaceae bacterium]
MKRHTNTDYASAAHPPARRSRRLFRGGLLTAIAALAVAGVALAYFLSSGSGTGQASVATFSPATISAPGTSGASITITWTSQASLSDSSKNSGISYTVQRKLGSGGTYSTLGSGGCGGSLPFNTSSCTDTVSANGTYFYEVVAHFGGNAWSATSNEVSTAASVDATAPTTTIGFPVNGTSYNAAGFANKCSSGTVTGICGTASDPSGVANVKVAIENSASRYWDGTAFVTSATPIFNGASGTTSWSYAFTPPANDTYTVLVQATDGVGNTTASGQETTATFLYDTAAPSVTLTAPANNSFANDTKPTFSGTAGNQAADSTHSADSTTVTVKIFSGPNTSGALLQTLTTTESGGSWSVAPTTALAANAQYTAQASQADAAGNAGTSSANTFVVDTTSPTVTMTAPANAATNVSLQPTFSGAAGNQAATTTASADGATVTIYVCTGTQSSCNQNSGTLAETYTTTRSGTSWTFTPSITQALYTNTTYTAQAAQSDGAGNTGTSGVSTFTTTNSFTVSTANTYVLTIAPHVTSFSFTIKGAGGGSATAAGAAGGFMSGTINVPDSSTPTNLNVVVGSGGGGESNVGATGGSGCANGGAGGSHMVVGGAGGAATCILTSGNSPIVVVGGGGGGGDSAGGAGSGGNTGANGTVSGTTGGTGGKTSPLVGGLGGTAANSTGDTGGTNGSGGSDTHGSGGNGGVGGGGGNGGGGGGGGYASGGGGGGAKTGSSGGGGGGSGFSGGAGGFTVTGISVTGTGSSGGAAGNHSGTDGSVTFTGTGLTDPPPDPAADPGPPPPVSTDPDPTDTTNSTTTDAATTTDATTTDTTTTTDPTTTTDTTTTDPTTDPASGSTTEGLSTPRQVLFFVVLGGSLLGFAALLTMPIPRRRRARRRKLG